MTANLRWLFLDLDAFFASCEQQEQPELRGRPVGVVPLETDSTCLIAASYEARPYGLKTGVNVGEAKKLCKELILVKARPKIYVQYHHAAKQAIERCVPIEAVKSIDEFACRLTGREMEQARAEAIAWQIKESVWKHAGVALNCSIGISTNPFLAKLGATMSKPNGLQILQPQDLPGSIRHLKLKTLPGVGNRMERRLWQSGISSVEQLYAVDSMRMRAIWGGVGGARFYGMLHGHDIPMQKTETGSLGHQHVLEPALRTREGGYEVLRRLLEKGVERMRLRGYYAKALTVNVKLTQHQGHWENSTRFPETQDTSALLKYMTDLCQSFPDAAPLRVGIMLHELVETQHHQYQFFESPRREKALHAVDAINQRFGRNTIHLGLHTERSNKVARDKIAFQRVPLAYEV